MISSIDPVKWNFEKLDLSQPRVMGILNLTPDSFYDGGRYNLADSAVQRAAQLLEEGASILDIGALSTRPNAKEVCEYEEWERLREILPLIRKEFPDILISVDTYRSGIAEKAVTEGADIINDISGGRFDNNMAAKIAEFRLCNTDDLKTGELLWYHRAPWYSPENDQEIDDLFKNAGS